MVVTTTLKNRLLPHERMRVVFRSESGLRDESRRSDLKDRTSLPSTAGTSPASKNRSARPSSSDSSGLEAAELGLASPVARKGRRASEWPITSFGGPGRARLHTRLRGERRAIA